MTNALFTIGGVSRYHIVRRLNRFTVETTVGKGLEKAYINNTGRLTECIVKDREAYCLKNPNSMGKTNYRLFAIRDHTSSILIDTRMQMQSFEEAANQSFLKWLSGCKRLSRNVRLGSSVVDYLFECDGKERYVELKSAALRGDSHYAMYPDCPTIRGRRHIDALTTLASNGGSATIVFIAALSGINVFKPNQSGDPAIPLLLRKAKKTGVAIRAIGIHYDPGTSTVYLDDPDLDIDLGNS